MKKKLKDYIVHFDYYITKDVCDKTVDYINDINFKEHKFYNPITKTEKTISGSQELSVSWDNIPTKNNIHQFFNKALREYQQKFKFSWFDGFQAFSPVRFNKYSETKKMALHCDHIHTLFDGQNKGIPILSILSVLNEDYEGGDFIMFDKYKIKLKTGDVLIFPSNFMYPHKVKPVLRGTRYSMISWAW
jgi:predicted 2-oxoglutarate/Fe(II)-dependent dioxygenase YbiX